MSSISLAYLIKSNGTFLKTIASINTKLLFFLMSRGCRIGAMWEQKFNVLKYFSYYIYEINF